MLGLIFVASSSSYVCIRVFTPDVDYSTVSARAAGAPVCIRLHQQVNCYSSSLERYFVAQAPLNTTDRCR